MGLLGFVARRVAMVRKVIAALSVFADQAEARVIEAKQVAVVALVFVALKDG